jgi:hypothetical protein
MSISHIRRFLSISALCVGLFGGAAAFATPASAADQFFCDSTQGEFGSFHVKACVSLDDAGPRIRGRAYLTLESGHSACTYTIRLRRNGVDVRVTEQPCPSGAFAGPEFTSWYNLQPGSYVTYASITRNSDGLQVTSNTEEWSITCC